MKVINAHIYDPSRLSIFKTSKSEHAKCTIIECSNSENCELYARSQCSLLAIFDVQHCKYGKRSAEQGFTQKAKGYHNWIEERSTKYKDQLNKLNNYNNKLAIVGEYVFIPYSHMNMNKSLLLERHGAAFVSGSHFIPIESFNVDTVINILEFRPQSLTGGEIKSYRADVLPKFVKHLKEIFPEMYTDIQIKYPAIDKILNESTNIGRKAFLKSLKPGTIITKYHDTNDITTEHWLWDGTYLTSTNSSKTFPVVDYETCEIKLLPKPNSVVVILTDEQVDDNTEFCD